MRLDEEVIMDFFREYISVNVSIRLQLCWFLFYFLFLFLFFFWEKKKKIMSTILNIYQMLIVCVDNILWQFISCESNCSLLKHCFVYWLLLQKVESRVRILSDLRELASAESLDTFTLVYTNILEHQPDCPVNFLSYCHAAIKIILLLNFYLFWSTWLD